MATLYGDQFASAYNTKPSTKFQPNDFNGEARRIYFEYTVTAAPTSADVIKVAKIPAGARVIDACLSFPDLGTVGTLKLGFAADVDAVETADDDAFLTSVDVHTAADTVSMQEQMAAGGANAGYCKLFAAECDLEIAVSTAWDATSGTIKGWLSYMP